eukprot:TRINITY_DN2081_c0_g1_i2.p1 TRINITY_DN2081_c0_g1~~TRINITY_DN2081_c0_g1_i2.p1  ORF type:complete len:360 (-),score=82.76 TRINITY_DN2081_c0_g1_i2:39-1118(-)
MSFLKKKSATVVIRPPEDAKRIQAVRKLKIMDSNVNEEGFDAITRLTKRVFNVPIAIITFVEEERTFFKSCMGLPGATQAPRDSTFCNYTVLSNESCLVVPDATKDARFVDNPFVTGGPGIKFYAGAPLVSREGFSLGSMCIIDTVPRETLNAKEIEQLKTCAKMAVWVTETRAEKLKLEQYNQTISFGVGIMDEDRNKLLKAVNMFKSGFISWNANRVVKFVNESFTRITGYSKEEASKFSGADLFKFDGISDEETQLLSNAFDGMEKTRLILNNKRKNGQTYTMSITIHTLFDAEGKPDGYHATLFEIGSNPQDNKSNNQPSEEKSESQTTEKTKGKRSLPEETFTPSKRVNGESVE